MTTLTREPDVAPSLLREQEQRALNLPPRSKKRKYMKPALIVAIGVAIAWALYLKKGS